MVIIKRYHLMITKTKLLRHAFLAAIALKTFSGRLVNLFFFPDYFSTSILSDVDLDAWKEDDSFGMGDDNDVEESPGKRQKLE